MIERISFQSSTDFNKLIPCFELFQTLNKHERLKNLLDMQIHNVYNQHILRFEELMPFVLLYILSMVPFQERLVGKLEHTEYNQYKCE